MIKYFLAASTLKAFSHNAFTRSLYRWLGNEIGATKRARGSMPDYYARNVRWMLNLSLKNPIFRDGSRVLEVGTGWIHWEAVTMALFFDIEAVLFDVWDNRQLEALKHYLKQFQTTIEHWPELPPERLDRAVNIINRICWAESFSEVYKLLRFEYVIESSGSLRAFPRDSFDVIVSARVLEHVNRASVPLFADDCYRILKPGGYSLHSISIGDHLYQYDMSTSPKQYLTFSDTTWKKWFENKIQYINRIQRSEWLELFERRGFELVECAGSVVNINNLRLSEQFRGLPRSDLECDTLKIVHRK